MTTIDCQTEQLTLPLFPPRTINELIAGKGITHLSLHPSRRLRTTWHVKINRFTNHRELHYPHTFDDAPETIKEALLAWAMLPVGKVRSQENRTVKRSLEKQLHAFLTHHTPRRTTLVTEQIWKTAGVRYDLAEVFDTVNKTYFNGFLKALLRWGTPASKTSYQSTKKEADGTSWHYITIAGIYNHPDVPRYAMDAIMYHEMLHIYIPPQINHGRRVVHGKAFKKMEQALPCYREWREWEKSEVRRIVKSLKRGLGKRTG